jgi:membrane protease YdiL (CAAX protease family)
MNIFTHLLAIFLAAGMPWLGALRMRALRRSLEAGDTNARLRSYQRSTWFKALLSMAAVLAARLSGWSWESVGLRWPAQSISASVWVVFLAAYAASILYFRKVGGRQMKILVKMAGPILPVTPRERRWFLVVALSAGITEEWLYRGFLYTYFEQLVPGSGLAATSVLFGLAHAYQGWKGALLTGVLGAVFGELYVTSGSLLEPVVLHSLIDLRIPIVLTPERLREAMG